MIDVPANPALASRLLELRAEKERRQRARQLREAYGINFYTPHRKQHLFHANGATGRYCRFGNRTGKTKCGAAEDVAWCMGARAWYKKPFDILEIVKDASGHYSRRVWQRHPGGDNHPLVTKGIPQYPVKGLLVCSDWDKAQEVFTNRNGSYDTLGDLFQLIPHEAIGQVKKSRGGHIEMIEIKRLPEAGGGSSLLYLDTVESFKHAWRSAESSDWDFVHYDEPPPQAMFVANKRGLVDRSGKFWINATPVEELWVNDEFSPEGVLLSDIDSGGRQFRKSERGGDRYIIEASTYDNPFIGEVRGLGWTIERWLNGIAEFEASLTSEERECRLYGLPLNLAGLIYKEFKYDLHVLTSLPDGWKDGYIPPDTYTFRDAWDVHDAIPQAVLGVATAPTGEAFIWNEIFETRMIGETAKLLRESRKGKFVAGSLIDPRAVIESPVTGLSIIDELAKHELFFDLGSKDMELGISSTREKFLERRPDGSPTIYVAPTCKRFIWEIMRYAYNPRTQKPVDKDDHMMENLRRLVLNGLDYIEPPKASDFVPRPMVSIGFAEDRNGAFHPGRL